jgi:hypothetical protein
MRTTLGIQAWSGLKASYSSACLVLHRLRSRGIRRQPLRRSLLLAVDRDGRELLGELEQQLIHLLLVPLRLEPLESLRQHLRIEGFAIPGNHGVVQLIDQAHREHRACMQHGCRLACGGARLVELFHELAACRQIGEDHIAGVVEEHIVDARAVADLSRNVKFHACYLFSFQLLLLEVTTLRI